MIYFILIPLLMLILLFASLRIITQYQRGVKFTLGKYTEIMPPGLRYVLPVIQTYKRVDIRQSILQLEPQEVMTFDNVNLKIDGMVFYTIDKPENAVLNVSNLKEQLAGKASSELKEIIGSLTMKDSLSKREVIASKLMKMLNEAINDKYGGKDWGINIRSVQINNIELPKELLRAMAKQAEAEREKEARVTKAQGEFEASKKFREAAKEFKENPIALRLRELQTYQEIGTEHNTLMMVIPETMIKSDGKWIIPAGISMAKNKDKK